MLPKLSEKWNFGKSYAEHLTELNKAKEMFDQLPVKIKQKFNNSIKDFAENGHAYLQNLINEQNNTQKLTFVRKQEEENLYYKLRKSKISARE